VAALLLGWGPVGAVALAGVTWISSSGVIAKVLTDLGRLGNRETPVILGVLVIEDLSMALYLPLLTALVAGLGLAGTSVAMLIAVGTVGLVLVVALRFGRHISRAVSSNTPEMLLLVVLGLTLLIAGLAAKLQVSAAVGAFLVGIALSGETAENARSLLSPLRDLFAAVFFVFFGLNTVPADIPPVLLPALALAVLTSVSKIVTGWYAARRAGVGTRGRLRAGGALVARGEFSIVIAGLAAGAEPRITPLATAYVMILVILGPLTARWTEPAVRGFQGFRESRRAARAPALSAPADGAFPDGGAAPADSAVPADACVPADGAAAVDGAAPADASPADGAAPADGPAQADSAGSPAAEAHPALAEAPSAPLRNFRTDTES
jgi:CPA2 family monovalent cation:H+ antiporter-2